jgi:hypothetical protein
VLNISVFVEENYLAAKDLSVYVAWLAFFPVLLSAGRNAEQSARHQFSIYPTGNEG